MRQVSRIGKWPNDSKVLWIMHETAPEPKPNKIDLIDATLNSTRKWNTVVTPISATELF